jgi:hypothetical protein
MDAASVFSDIYARDAWSGGSGPGSTPAFCGPLVDWLVAYCNAQNVGSIVDLGCGDCQWMPQVVGKIKSRYLGVDCVLDVVRANKMRFLTDMDFMWGHFDADPAFIPRADLYWMKDVLQHWPDDEIVSFLDRFFAAKPGARLLVCNCADQKASPRILDLRWRFHPLSGTMEPLSRYSPERLFAWNGKHVYRLRCAGHQRAGSFLPDRTSDTPSI